MKTFPSLYLLLALCLLPLLAGAQAGTGTTQTVTGVIFDEASKSPLAGVSITLANGQPPIGTVTDANGTFKLTGVPLGRQTVRLSYMGYEERQLPDILVTAGKEVQLTVSMTEAVRKMKEVTIVYKKAKDKTRTNNEMAQVSARSFNVDETKRYAGALGDPSRMAANFAGVVSGNDANNDIVVRGNAPTGMLWQLEGLNIPNPNHYGSLASTGGPISLLNNNNIDKSDFLTSAFPAQYGNALAGVFDIRLRNGNRDKAEFVGQVGFNGFELGAEGPLGKRKQTAYLVNYRYSTLGAFQKLGINFGTGTVTPQYQDVNYKVTHQFSKQSKLSVFGIAGNSRINFLGEDVDTAKQELYSGNPYANERIRYATTITGAAYEHQLSSRTFTRLTLGYSTTLEKFDVDSIGKSDRSVILPNSATKSTTRKLSAAWLLMHKLDARNALQAGATWDQTSFRLMDKSIYKGYIEEVHVDQEGSFGLAQAYLQWKHRFSGSLTGVAGLHGQYLTLNGSAAVEPRASLRYALNARHAVSLGYGLHHQAQNIYTYFTQTNTAGGALYTNKSLGFTRSQHAVLTYDWNLTEQLRLKTEAYYQYVDRAPVEQRPSAYSALNLGGSFGPFYVDSLLNRGTGHNYGAEVTLERFFNQGYYFLVTGSLFRSQYSGSDGVERNTAFNTGHVLNVLAGREFRLNSRGSVLALNLKVSDVGGRYLTPLDLDRSVQEGKSVYREDLAFTEKQPDYFRTDLRVAFRKEYKRSTLELAVDFQNLTAHQNIFSQYYDADKGKVVKTYQQGFFPVPLIRYTF